VRHELGAVVEAHVVRRPVFEGQAIQDIDDAVGVDGAIDFDRECGSPEIVEAFLCRFRLGFGFPDLVVDG